MPDPGQPLWLLVPDLEGVAQLDPQGLKEGAQTGRLLSPPGLHQGGAIRVQSSCRQGFWVKAGLVPGTERRQSSPHTSPGAAELAPTHCADGNTGSPSHSQQSKGERLALPASPDLVIQAQPLQEAHADHCRLGLSLLSALLASLCSGTHALLGQCGAGMVWVEEAGRHGAGDWPESSAVRGQGFSLEV